MQNSQDILEDISALEQEPRSEIYTVTAISWTLQNLISLALFFYSFYLLNINLVSSVGTIAIFTQLLTSRGLGLLALVLFWRKRKSGWMLTTICCMSAVIRMFSTVLHMLQSAEFAPDGSFIPWVGFLSVFALSVFSLVLVLTNTVRHFFSITRKQLIWSVATGIVLVIVATLFEHMLISKLSGHS